MPFQPVGLGDLELLALSAFMHLFPEIVMAHRRSTVTLAAAVAMLIVTAVTSPALAMYKPNVGRFLQRDPIGTATGPSVATGFIARDATPRASRQYPDGMNTYAAHHVMRGGVDACGIPKPKPRL